MRRATSEPSYEGKVFRLSKDLSLDENTEEQGAIFIKTQPLAQI
jgi:hypothetical protein